MLGLGLRSTVSGGIRVTIPSNHTLPHAARSGWITVVVSLCLLGMTLLGSLWLAGQVAESLRERADSASARLKARSDQFVGRGVLVLLAGQGLFTASRDVEEAEYRRFVEAVLQGNGGVRSLNYVDAAGVIRWVAPRTGNEGALALNLTAREGAPALRRALTTGAVSATDPIMLQEGGRGVLMFAPLGRTGAAVQVVLDMDAYTRALGIEAHRTDLAVSLVDGTGAPVWTHGQLAAHVVTAPLEVGDRHWRLQVSALPHWLDYLPVYFGVAIGLTLWVAALALIWADLFASARLAREVAARTDELRTSRDQLRVILDGIADGVLVIEPADGRVVYVNDMAVSMLGVSPAAFDGTIAERTELLRMRDEQGVPLPAAEVPASRALRGEVVRGAVLRFNHVITDEERVMVVAANPIFDDAGAVRFVVMILHDLTERVALERRLKEQLAELQTLDRLKNDFLNVVTHELRTPLTSIRGFAEFLEDGIGGVMSAEQAEFVRHIQLNADQLGALVDDLLDMARLEAGKFTLRRAPVDMAALTREVVDSFRPQAQEGRITLTLGAPTAPVTAEADPMRMRQVLNNLLSNALKFTPAGGTVTVTFAATETMLDWRVADTGIGVASDQVPHLFSKFFQAESALNRTYKGTGLGLAITKGLVEAHGGHIAIASTEGQGTVVHVTVPTAPRGPA
jgi:signal transduction histidine kinase